MFQPMSIAGVAQICALMSRLWGTTAWREWRQVNHRPHRRPSDDLMPVCTHLENITMKLQLASCLIYGQPFQHTALPQMTTLAAQATTWQIIGRCLCAFRCSFGCVLLLNQIYLTTMYHSTIPLRFIWSICPGNIRVRLKVALFYFSIFHEE